MSKVAKKASTPSKKSGKRAANTPDKSSQEKGAADRTVKVVATEQIHKLIPEPMVKHLFGRILAVMRSRGTDYPTESEEGFGTLAFAAMKPQTTAEVLLCSQMVATWEVGMGMLTAAKLADDYRALSEKGNLAVKLLSIFERQFATLTKARRPPQTVVVEHVHKHLHVTGQAPGPTGEVKIIEGQPYESTTPAALALAAAPAMLGETPEVACPVPSPGDEKRPLSNPRRRLSGRTKR
jgi:hypothetical protein